MQNIEKSKRYIELMRIVDKEKYVEVSLPIISQGKFRFKNRNDIQDFGEGFGPSKVKVQENSYLEWQIGYDTIIGKNQKETILNTENFKFKGDNNKDKYPYELSEIAFLMCKNRIISKEEIIKLYEEIRKIKRFLKDEFKIESQKEENKKFNNIEFLSSSIKLPTFVLEDKETKLVIEIMIQKQQYATGVQPMVYVDVPVNAFINKDDIINHTSKDTPFGNINFDSSFKNVIFNLFLCFGMCSQAHNHDVQEILKVIINNTY